MLTSLLLTASYLSDVYFFTYSVLFGSLAIEKKGVFWNGRDGPTSYSESIAKQTGRIEITVTALARVEKNYLLVFQCGAMCSSLMLLRIGFLFLKGEMRSVRGMCTQRPW